MNYEHEPVEGDYDAYGITLEDRYAATYEERADAFWAAVQGDALECSASCHKSLFGYHTLGCPRQDNSDRAMERRDEAVISMSLGK
jgi:hypothetical protein